MIRPHHPRRAPLDGQNGAGHQHRFQRRAQYLEKQGKEGAVVGFFSLEMSAEQLATRILADLSEVPSDRASAAAK